MSDSANKLPVLTDEQRRANLEKLQPSERNAKPCLTWFARVPSPSSRLPLIPDTGVFPWFAC